MNTRVRLTYDSPSFLEGMYRLFDILGNSQDDLRVQRISSTSRLDSDEYSIVDAAQAIDEAAQIINEEMSIVGARMRATKGK